MANKKQVVNLSTGKSETKTLTAAEEIAKAADEALSASKEEVDRPRRVKLEAKRRIIAVYPEWKQRNLTARGVELVRIKTDRVWTAEEQTEVDAIQAIWDWVKSVRTASDDLEAQNPVPADFIDDIYWIKLAGTVAVNATSVSVMGTGTAFDTDFTTGDDIVVWANSSVWESRTVNAVANSTSLDIEGNFTISGVITLAGTVSVNATSITVTGVGTAFDVDLAVGDHIVVANSTVSEDRVVDAITNATSLEIETGKLFTLDESGLGYSYSGVKSGLNYTSR